MWTKSIIPDPGHNLASSELLTEQSSAEEDDSWFTEMKQSYIEETRSERDRNLPDPVCDEKSIILVKERKWKKYSCLSIVQRNNALNKFVMILVRNNDQDERDTDGAVHWNTISPKLMREFGSRGARGFSEKDWLRHINEGNNKTRFEYCENFKKSLMYIRAIQGHTGGNMIAPEADGARRNSM